MKKIFSAFLLMTMMVASVGSFVSCSDIEESIAAVDEATKDNAASIKDLESKIAALQTALATAQADAAAAKAEANAAKQAAATAKAEAIEAALAEIAKVQDDVDAANAEIKKINDALAGYATKEAVELLESTIEKYSALTNKNADAIEAIKAELAALKEAGVTAENFAKVVADMKKIDENLVNFVDALKDLANRIQSITWVPTKVGQTSIEPYGFSYKENPSATAKYSDLMINATYQVAPAELAAEMEGATVFFSSTPLTKADKAKTFAAEVISVDAERGQFTVRGNITSDSEAYAMIVNATTADKTNVAVALNVVTDASATVGEETIETGSYVTSAYTYVKPDAKATIFKDVYAMIKLWNTEDDEEYTGSDNILVSYNDAASERALFENVDFRVVYGDNNVITLDEAEELVGIEALDVTYDGAVAYYNAAGTAITTGKPIAVTGKNLAATAKIVAVANKQPKEFVGYSAKVTLNNFKVNKYNTTGIPATVVSGYEIDKAKATITFEAVDHAWNYLETNATEKLWNSNPDSNTGAAADATFQAKELAVTASNIDLTGKTFDAITGTSTYNFYQKQKVGDTWYEGYAKVSVLSSKAVKLEAVKIPYVAGKDVKWTLAGTFTVDQTAYKAELVINMGAMPTNKTINVGAYTVVRTTAQAMKVPVAPLAKIVETDGSYYGANFDFASFYTKVAATGLVTGTCGLTAVDTEATVIKNDNYAALTARHYIKFTPEVKVVNNANVESSVIVIPASNATANDDSFIIAQKFTFAGVVYTLKATVQVEKPTYSITTNPTYVSNGVVTLGGKVVLPSQNPYNGALVAASDFDLNEVDLSDYVIVNLPTEAPANEFKLRYTLKTDLPREADGVTLKYTDRFLPTIAAGAGTAPDYAYKSINEDMVVNWASSKYNEVEYEVALVVAKNTNDPTTDEVIGTPVTIKLQIPTLVTISAGNAVEATYNNNGTSEANVAGAIVVKDKDGKSIYNVGLANSISATSDFTGLQDFYSYVNLGTAQAPNYVEATAHDAWDVYGQTFSLPIVAGSSPTEVDKSKITVTVNGAAATIDYTVDTNGTIIVAANNANVTGDIVFTVPVSMNYDFDGYAAQTVNAQVVFKVK